MRRKGTMLTIFSTILAAGWLAIILTVFCPLRALRQRRVIEECED